MHRGQTCLGQIDETGGLQLEVLAQELDQPLSALPLLPVPGQHPGQAEGVVQQALLHKDLSGVWTEKYIGQGEYPTPYATPGVVCVCGEGGGGKGIMKLKD